MNCPPSARLGELIPDRSSEYAAEGTDAHSLCEYKLRRALGLPADDPVENLSYYNKLMDDCCDDYVSFVMEIVEEARRACPDTQVFIEMRVDYSRWAEEGYGTSDAVIVSDGGLHVVDFKYGEGVPVEANDNVQLRLYCIGAAEMFGHLYGFTEVRMSIFQPRRNSVSTAAMSVDALYQWADEVVRPVAELAYAGGGEYACGDWCKFCRAKATCRARAEENLRLAVHDFKEPALLEPSEIASILGKLDRLKAWAEDVQKHALAEALRGVQFEGYKLVAGRSNRRYTNELEVADKVKAAGYDPYKMTVLGVTAMYEMLGAKQFDELLGELITKPPGKPSLALISDKRQPLAVTSAAEDFAD
jgi:hypothetical protein